MSHSQHPDGSDAFEEDDLDAVYGDVSRNDGSTQGTRKRDFLPWHHPVKQFVRSKQWLKQADRLLGDVPIGRRVRYLTLPGADMLDVRLLGEYLRDRGRSLECLGFNSRPANNDPDFGEGGRINAESVLRQEGIISDNSLTLPDRFQDIAVESSQANVHLRSWKAFDIINIDICGHFASGDEVPNAFEAMNRLVAHQRTAEQPWLLMLTTRVHPDHLAAARVHFDSAIQRNVNLDGSFRAELATAIEIDEEHIEEELLQVWAAHDSRFVKLYAIGLGKHLLHLFHNQYQSPARVELKSCMAYRVHGDVPDMLSIAFLIRPGERVVIPANAPRILVIPNVEVVHANQIVRKAARLLDVDSALEDEMVLGECIAESEELLYKCNYETSSYREWLYTHPTRPLARPVVVHSDNGEGV